MAKVIGTLIFEMAANVARLQSDMDRANRTVNGAMDGIKGAAGLAKTALGSIGLALSVESFAGMIKGSIDSMNAMRELGFRTGQTTEVLSSLKPIARASGVDLEQVAVSLQKLSKNMLEMADTGKGKAAAAFRELGIEVVGADGKLRSNVEVMREAAVKLEAMTDETRKLALEQLLFGKSGAQLAGFLHELAEAHDLAATMTTKQTDQAHQLSVMLGKLNAQSEGLKREMATGLMPALISILGAFQEVTSQQTDVRGFFESTGQLLQWVAQIATGAWAAVRLLGEAFGGLMVVLDRFLHFDLKGALGVFRDVATEVAKIANQYGALIEKMGQTPPLPKVPARQGAVGADALPGAGAGDDSGGGGSGESSMSMSAEEVSASAGSSGPVAAHLAAVSRELKTTRDVGKQVTDVLSSGVEKAARNFKDLRGAVKDVARELVNMVGQYVSSAAKGGVNSLLGDLGVKDFISGMFGGGRAGGGGVNAGTTYLVGEDGPELFTPGSSGGITPNGALGGDLNFTIYAPGADASKLNQVLAEVRALKATFDSRSVAAMRTYLAQRGQAA